MAIPTTNYNFQLPTVGADEDNWGYLLNGNWDSIDSLLLGVQTSYYGSVAPSRPTNPTSLTGTFWFNTTNFGTTGLVPLTVWDGTEYVLLGDLDPTKHTFSIPGASFLVGQISPYAGIDLTTPIPLWQFCNGQAISRTTYSALFAKITQTFTGTTNGTTTITVADTSNLQTGWFISGNNIPSNSGAPNFTPTIITGIVTNTSITINNAATGSGSTSLVAAPYGIGDGATTFNVPNLNGKLPLGQGTSTTTFNMGATGGRDSTTDVPNHVHTVVAGKTGTGLVNYAGFAPNANKSILNSSMAPTGAVPVANSRYINLDGSNNPIASTAEDTEINTGGVSSLNLMNPYTTVNYIIFAGV